jgi:hypothetical protein
VHHKHAATVRSALDRGLWVIRAQERLLEAVGESHAPCFVCSAPSYPREVIVRFQKDVSLTQDNLTKLEAELQKAELDELSCRNRLEDWERQVGEAHKANADAQAVLEREHASLTAARRVALNAINPGAPDNYQGPSSAEAQTQIAQLEAAQTEAKNREVNRARLRELERHQERAKSLELSAKEMLIDIMRRVKNAAEVAVNKQMTAGLRAEYDLESKLWQVITPDDVSHGRASMCGFERCSLIPAYAAACTAASPLRVLTLDDEDVAGFSLQNFPKFCQALARAVQEGRLTQVFCTGSRFDPILDQIQAAGFTIVNVG